MCVLIATGIVRIRKLSQYYRYHDNLAIINCDMIIPISLSLSPYTPFVGWYSLKCLLLNVANEIHYIEDQLMVLLDIYI